MTLADPDMVWGGEAAPVLPAFVGLAPAKSVLAVKFGSSIVSISMANVGLPLMSVKLRVNVVTVVKLSGPFHIRYTI